MQFTKKYQVWEQQDGNQFSFNEFDTLDECIAAQKYGQWYITKKIVLSVGEMGEGVVSAVSTQIAPTFIKGVLTSSSVPVDEDQLPPGYATGPIGRIG